MAKTLPKAKGGEEPLPEGLVWLLMTGNFPNQTQMESISQEIKDRSKISNDVVKFIKSLPKNMHPMTQLSTAVLYLQP
jgi:citrate synthase